MTFDELYPDAPLWFQPPVGPDDDGVVKCPQSKPCWTCETPTVYVDLDFEAHLCSEECRDVKWEEYFRACQSPPCIGDRADSEPY